jgi:transcriptional regulator with XRE-family HTH domain
MMGHNPIQFWRTQRNMTQRDLGRRAILSETYIWRLETGRATPSTLTLRRLSKALDVSLEALCGGCRA